MTKIDRRRRYFQMLRELLRMASVATFMIAVLALSTVGLSYNAFAYHGQEVLLALDSAQFIPRLNTTEGSQVKVLVNYTVNTVNDPSIVNQTINAVMNVYTLNGTLVKTSSFPAGFTANNFGTQQLATTIKGNPNPIQNITAVITITNAAKLIPLSNSSTVKLNLGQILQ
jgi:hypothetical protein